MTKKEFIEQLENMLEAQHGTLAEDEMLYNVVGWDSLAVMSFIALVDESLGITLKAPEIFNAKSIADLIALVSVRLES